MNPREPTEAERRAIAEAHARQAARPARPTIKTKTVDREPGAERRVIEAKAPHDDPSGYADMFLEVFGTTSSDFMLRVLDELSPIVATGATSDDGWNAAMNSALAVLGAIGPKDEAEALLATQMIATHTLGMKTMAQAAAAQTAERRQIFVAMATKLTRTYAAQMEALAKVRGGGKQEVTVIHEHRHTYVAAGGQAIIGDVLTGGGVGGQLRIAAQSDQPSRITAFASLEVASGGAVWGQDAGRRGMSAACDPGQTPVQASRRHEPRRAARASERQLASRSVHQRSGGAEEARLSAVASVEADT